MTKPTERDMKLALEIVDNIRKYGFIDLPIAQVLAAERQRQIERDADIAVDYAPCDITCNCEVRIADAIRNQKEEV